MESSLANGGGWSRSSYTIKQGPHRLEGGTRRIQWNRRIIGVRVMAPDQPRNGLRMIGVGITMGGEKFNARAIGNPVEAVETVNLGGRDLGHLRFVNVERGESRSDRQIATQMSESIDQRGGCRHRWRIQNLLASEAESRGELEPELGMVVATALLIDQVFEQELARFEILAARVQAAQITRESSDMLIILHGVVAEAVGGERPGSPRLVKGMLQQAQLRRQQIQRRDGFVWHWRFS